MVEQTLEEFEAWDREFSELFYGGELGRAVEKLAEDIEWTPSPALPGSRTLRGRREVAEFYAEMSELLTGLSVERRDSRQIAAGVFVTSMRLTATGRADGPPVERFVYQVCETRDGEVARVLFFENEAVALAVAEEAASRRA